MTAAELIFAFIGSGLSALGLFALYRAWKGHAKKKLLSYLGWAALFLAVILWAVSGGKDRGVALGIIVISLQALLFVAYQAFIDKAPKKKRGAPKLRKMQSEEKLGLAVLSRRAGKALWVSVGCGALSYLTAIGLHELFWNSGMHASNSLVLALFIFPILWASLSALSLTSQKTGLKLGTYAFLGVSSAVIICLGNGVL